MYSLTKMIVLKVYKYFYVQYQKSLSKQINKQKKAKVPKMSGRKGQMPYKSMIFYSCF